MSLFSPRSLSSFLRVTAADARPSGRTRAVVLMNINDASSRRLTDWMKGRDAGERALTKTEFTIFMRYRAGTLQEGYQATLDNLINIYDGPRPA